MIENFRRKLCRLLHLIRVKTQDSTRTVRDVSLRKEFIKLKRTNYKVTEIKPEKR